MTLRFTFPQSKHCFQKADFDLLFKTGKKKFGSFFVIYFRPIAVGEHDNSRRFGLVVGKKATGNNVKRNLVKRLIRESYRVQQHSLAELQVLVLATKKVKPADRLILRTDLDKLWDSLK